MKTCRVDLVSLIPGCCVVGDTGLGVLGSSVIAAENGPDGPPFGLIDLEPGDETAEVRWLIETRPSTGKLTATENSSFYFQKTSIDIDDIQHFYVRGFRKGKDRGVKIVSITVGPPRSPASLNLLLT
jgi:hypothetical protein